LPPSNDILIRLLIAPAEYGSQKLQEPEPEIRVED